MVHQGFGPVLELTRSQARPFAKVTPRADNLGLKQIVFIGGENMGNPMAAPEDVNPIV
jgi:hypothetical protein